ncbi:hypothetical protein BABINDRAFT_163757 [Babjeviella inositovora NRRL Y-12698]|uniref:SH3 domain-containing protein n=1 Tax=Babjeviella inositovora NRRL Y-12698 TaxID=984486 RepID=A0A1E3QJS8_9ASCO|nr:uncharacterized protein BABINDRAFT_163757 [Babjeviella inositovora NRRL Y-12698]ODQ77257.1 hypothetical protein BABINDRAFT_163757 [Babjeviella inositovora NRRL Y-12698]
MSQPVFDGTFVNNFWGQENTGFDVVQTHMANGATSVDELVQFCKHKIQLEQEYARKLEALSKQMVGSCESGTLKQSVNALLHETRKMSEYHNQQASHIGQAVYEPLRRFADHFSEQKRAIERNVRLLKEEMDHADASVEKLRAAYAHECAKYKALRAETQLALGRELEKIHVKIGRTHEAMTTLGQKYHLAVTQAAQLHDQYVLNWKLAARRLESLEGERINEVRKNVWEYTNAISTSCVNDADSAEEVRTVLEKVDAKGDVYSFVERNHTGNQIFDPALFIDYERGQTETPRNFIWASFGGQSKESTPSTYEERPKSVAATQLFGDSGMQPIFAQSKESPSRLAPPEERAFFGPAGSNVSDDHRRSNMSDENRRSHYSASTLFERAKSQSGSEASAYTAASASSNKTWSSPDRRRSRASREPEYAQMHAKPVPVLAPPSKPVPLVKDFSMNFDPLSKALDSLNHGGNGDMNQFRKSVRAAEASKSAPVTPCLDRARPAHMYAHEARPAYSEAGQVRPTYSKTDHARPHSTYNDLPAPFESPVRTKSRTRKSFLNLNSFIAPAAPTPEYCLNGAKVVTKAIAKYPFQAGDEEIDVSMERGDRLLVYEMMSDNWFGVQNLRTSQCGTVPGNYVKYGDNIF